MLQLRAAYTHRGLPYCILISQRFSSENAKPARPQSKYKTDIKSLVTGFKKELGAAQANAEKESVKRKVEEQKELQRMLELNRLENEKMALHRYFLQSRELSICIICRAERLAKEKEAKLARRIQGDEKRAAMKKEVLEEQTKRIERAIVSNF